MKTASQLARDIRACVPKDAPIHLSDINSLANVQFEAPSDYEEGICRIAKELHDNMPYDSSDYTDWHWKIWHVWNDHLEVDPDEEWAAEYSKAMAEVVKEAPEESQAEPMSDSKWDAMKSVLGKVSFGKPFPKDWKESRFVATNPAEDIAKIHQTMRDYGASDEAATRICEILLGQK